MPRYSRPLTRFLGRPLFPRAFHGLCHGAVPDSSCWMIRPVMTSYTFGIVFSFCLVIDLRQERQGGGIASALLVKYGQSVVRLLDQNVQGRSVSVLSNGAEAGGCEYSGSFELRPSA